MGVESKAPTVYIEAVVVVRPIKVLGMMLGCFAILCLVLNVAATAWLFAGDSGGPELGKLREGLWERCRYSNTTVDLFTCKLGLPDSDWVHACRAMSLMSLLTCLGAVVVTSMGLSTDNKNTKYKLYAAGCVAFFCAVAFELISVVYFPIKFLEEIQSRGETEWSFGWAYIIGWAAAIMEFAAGLFLLLDRGAEEIIYRERTMTEEDEETV